MSRARWSETPGGCGLGAVVNVRSAPASTPSHDPVVVRRLGGQAGDVGRDRRLRRPAAATWSVRRQVVVPYSKYDRPGGVDRAVQRRAAWRVTLVAGWVAGAATAAVASRVARNICMAWLEHGSTREDAVLVPVSELPFERRLGAFPLGDGRAEFRVWAPDAERIALRVDGRERSLDDAGHGVYEAMVETLPGVDYAYLVDGAELPDPCSRWQPEGLRGPSRLLDPARSSGPTRAGRRPASTTWSSTSCTSAPSPPRARSRPAIPHLRGLRELGVTAIELMPVAEFPGRHGWGYDGVYLSAAHSAYGGPHGLPAARRRRPRRGPRRAPRRRLQPRRRVRHQGA